jgi:DNA-binding NarL/FixJ family response regulator
MLSTKIIIVDDHCLFADGVEQIVNAMDGFKVIAKAENGKVLLQLLNKNIPNIILLDINMPLLNGVDAAYEIRKKYPEIKIVFLSMHVDSKIIETAKKNGIYGFINKGITAPNLQQAIINIANGNPTFILPEQNNHNEIKVTKKDFASLFKLSERELEIITLITTGKKNKEIAQELELSAYTTETHRKNIYRKLNVQSIAELMSFAIEHDILK